MMPDERDAPMFLYRGPKADDDWSPPTFGMGVVIGVLGGLVVAALISAVVTLPWTYLG